MPTQESSLRVGVDSRDAERGADRADKALKKVSNRASRTETQFDKLKKSMGGFGSVVAGLGLGLAVREFGQLLDVTTGIDNRLRLVTNSTAELNAVYDELLAISNETKSSLQNNADLFNRLAIATADLNMTYREQLDLTRGLNQAMIISGETAQSAAGPLLQLSQGLAAGALRGEELNSVLEGLPKVADVIAEHMGVTRGELRAMGQEGLITADIVVDAFKAAADDLDEEFTKITPTIAGAFTVIQNKITDFVRDVNGVGSAIASLLLMIADNFDILAGAIAGVATVVTARLLPSLGAMTIALASNPIGLMLTAVGALSAGLTYLAGQTYEFGETTASGWQVAKAAVVTAWEVFVNFFSGIKDFFSDYFTALGTFVSDTVTGLEEWTGSWGVSADSITGILKDAINGWIGLQVAAFQSISDVWKGLPALFELVLKKAGNLVAEGVERIVNSFVSGLGLIGEAVDYFTGGNLGDQITDTLSIDLGRLNTEEAEKRLAESADNIERNFKQAMSTDYIQAAMDAVSDFGDDALQRLKDNLEDVVRADKEAQNAQDLLNNSFKEGTVATGELTEAQQRHVDILAKYKDGLLRAQSESDALLDKLALLDEMFMSGDISSDVYTKELEKLQGSFEDLEGTGKSTMTELQTFMEGTAQNMERSMSQGFFAVMQGESINLVDTFKRSMDQMVADMLAAQARMSLFGEGGTGGIVSTIGSWFGGGKAAGGYVEPSTMYEVNEEGPELLSAGGKDFLMTGDSGGWVHPSKGGAGDQISITQNIYANDADSFRRSESQIARETTRELDRKKRAIS